MQDRTNPVKVRWGYSYDQDNYNETEHKLSTNGLVELTFLPPVTNVTTLGIEVSVCPCSAVVAVVCIDTTIISAIYITKLYSCWQ